MGASASKPARSAAAAASRRQYPSSPSPSTTTAVPRQQQQQPKQQQKQATRAPEAGPTYHSSEEVSSSRTQAIDLDAQDPHFAASLRSLGAVTPNPTMSNSSTFNSHARPSVFPDANNNPALLVVSSRARITKAAEQEQEAFGRPSHPGREFLDALTIRQIVSMRDRQRLSPGDIERLLRLKKGVVSRLGEKGIVSEPA
ncbi:hypothetical protein PISL3812_07146 [Talaromyces islandicus]|uniref:Helix-turn-helix domain-containing protein n=1 Tax=Talaromyces islandicus TaxID=28573 RepID=A0A0U1M3H2_TALIS|nr:hypothetical protein PISL3812_07146 [Talaromyces islandicus]